MKNQASNFTEFRKYYLSEYELYDGECFITFNLLTLTAANGKRVG